MEEHFKLAQDLRVWRNEGILIPGSGNVVHDLGSLNWADLSAPAYDRALEFDRFVQEKVTNGDHQALVHFESLGATARMANPTNAPYLPLLYTLGASASGESLTKLHSGMEMGSISMRSFQLG